MQKVLVEQMDLPDRDALTFDDRFEMLVDAEQAHRDKVSTSLTYSVMF